MITNLSKIVLFFSFLASTQALAVPVLELDCRIDNRVMSSYPRIIKIKDGNAIDIDCQKHASCKNSIYEITMGYNSAYEQVYITITDTETKKRIVTDFHLPPNGVGGLSAALEFNYGDVVKSNDEIPVKDPQGRFFRISCWRVN